MSVCPIADRLSADGYLLAIGDHIRVVRHPRNSTGISVPADCPRLTDLWIVADHP